MIGDPVRLTNHKSALLGVIYFAAQLTPAIYEHTFYFLLGFLASMAGPAPVQK